MQDYSVEIEQRNLKITLWKFAKPSNLRFLKQLNQAEAFKANTKNVTISLA